MAAHPASIVVPGRLSRSPARVRFIGGSLAFLLSVSGAICLVALCAVLPLSWSTARTWLLLGALAAGLGAIVGAILGWQLALVAADRRRPLRGSVIGVTVRAVLAGAALVAGLGILSPGDDLARIDNQIQLADVATTVLVPVVVRAGWAITVLGFGLALFSIPATVVVAPIVTVWILALRAIVGDRQAR